MSETCDASKFSESLKADARNFFSATNENDAQRALAQLSQDAHALRVSGGRDCAQKTFAQIAEDARDQIEATTEEDQFTAKTIMVPPLEEMLQNKDTAYIDLTVGDQLVIAFVKSRKIDQEGNRLRPVIDEYEPR